MPILGLQAFVDNYIWIIIHKKNRTLTCVDPGCAGPVLAYAKQNNLTLKTILITHHHADHAGGIHDLLQEYPEATVFGPHDERLPLITHKVYDKDIIHVDPFIFGILYTPGHTSTHLCYYEPNQGWLFCGDTLFSAGCGRVFDGTIEQLHHSILLLKRLPKNTKIYCGHEYTMQNLRYAATVEPENETIKRYINHLRQKNISCSLPSSIALEEKINPFMRTHTDSVQTFANAQGISSKDSLLIFKCLRDTKNVFI